MKRKRSLLLATVLFLAVYYLYGLLRTQVGTLEILTIKPSSVIEQMGSDNVYYVALPYINTIISQPPEPFLQVTSYNLVLKTCFQFLILIFLYIKCSQEGQRQPLAIIGVKSVAIDKLQRMSVRKTWARKAGSFDIRVFFMIGFRGDLLQVTIHNFSNICKTNGLTRTIFF